MFSCHWASDMLHIKLALNYRHDVAQLSLFYPLTSYYRTKEALERARDAPLAQFILFIKESAEQLCNNIRQAAQQRLLSVAQRVPLQSQVYAQAPIRPRPDLQLLPSTVIPNPGNSMRAALVGRLVQGGGNDPRKTEVVITLPVTAFTAHKTPASGPTYQRSEPEVIELVEMECVPTPATADKLAVPALLTPVLRPRIVSCHYLFFL